MDKVAGGGIAQLPQTTETIIPGDIGKWTHDPDILRRLPTLQSEQDTSLADYYVGIPTPWARSIFFDYLFLDNDESKKERDKNGLIVEEWLGMLAAVLLGNDNIKKEVFLPSDKKNLNSLQGAIVDLLPHDYPSPTEFSYDMIFLKNVLIGSTSPYTICFPCPEYSFGSAPVKWYDTTRRKFCNPLDHLDEAGKIRFKVSALEKFDHLIDEVQAKITKIKSEINESIARKADCSTQQEKKKKKELENKLKKLGDIKKIFESYVKDIAVPTPAVLEIESGTEKILIISDDTRLTEGNIYLSEMLENDRGFGNKIGDRAQKWINPKKFFMTDKILKWQGCKNKTTKFQNEVYTPPLSPNILNYFEIKDIKLDYETEAGSEKNIKEVVLTIPVNKNGKPGEMVINKSYVGREIKITETPSLGIWPDFAAKDWDIYYAIFDKTLGEASNLQIEPLQFIQDPFTYESKLIVKLDKSNIYDEKEIIVWQLDSFPHVLSCKQNGKDCGLIFPHPQEKLRETANSCILAIDFGASNTCYAYRQGSDIETFQLKNHFLNLNSADQSRKDPLMDINFFPDFTRLRERQKREMKPYFQSIYGEKQNSYFKVIKDGLIIFYTNILLESEAPKITIRDNLKWLKNSDVFLNQLLLMLLAELRCKGFESISEFRFSFPYAFDTTMRGHYQNKWDTMIGSAKTPDSLVNKTVFRHKPPTVVKKAESEAAALFMEGEQILRIATNSPQMVLDIGGSTTDIAIWARDKMLLQSSVLLAGNIVSQYMSLNKEFLQFYWDTKNQMKSDELRNHEDFATFVAHFNDNPFNSFAALMSQEKELNLVNSILMNPDKDELKEIKKLVAFIFSAYFFYAGKLVEYCYNNYESLSYKPIIALVGKGSELIELILGRRPDDGEEKFRFLDFLKQGIVDDSLRSKIKFDGDSLQDQIKDPSNKIIDPKLVVAKGLLQSLVFDTNDRAEDRCWAVVGEEGFMKENQPLPSLTDLYSFIKDPKVEIDNIVIPDTFPEIDRFIDIFNKKWKDVLKFRDPVTYDPANIKSRLETVYSDIKKDLYSLQPLFIEEVKAVIFEHWKFKMPRPVM